MAHSDTCCCHGSQVSKVGLCSSPLGPASQGTRTPVTDDFPSVPLRMETYVNVFRWDVLFVLHKLQCWFLFKCFKFSLCWRSLFVSFVWQRYLERKERGHWQTGPTPVMFNVRGDRRQDGTRTLHTSNHLLDCWTRTPFSLPFSLHLFPSLYGCQTMLSSEGWTWTAAVALRCVWWHCLDPRPLSGQSKSPLRQRWNRLPALSALKCSLTSHPDCEKLI